MGLLLALVTLLVYLPVAGHGFSIFDDDDYVSQNHIVQNGLTWSGVKWAFTSWYASNWHPVTWLSHMLDCELFGLNAGAHHLVNVLFHTANAVLLFLLLLRLTRELWPSAYVAALFAWHPLHVESVAWISERKDVLSTFFALLTLLAYVRHVQRMTSAPALSRFTFHVSRFYWLALAFFALGLMAKPMLVTLPFVMLLLDYWPLQRAHDERPAVANWSRLVLEKWLFFVLAAASCVMTYPAQNEGGLVVSLKEMPLEYRLGNALLAYNLYLLKTFWPVRLAVLYPLPKTISLPVVFISAAILIAISVAVWLGRKRGPYMLVGWLWFLGTLVPVIGLVQIGHAAMADRYTYFPAIGVFIAVTFGVRDLANRFRFPSRLTTVAAVLILGGCVVLAENQLRCWRDDESLFSHAINVVKDNEPAHLCLGLVYKANGQNTAAMAEYRTALRLNPDRIKTYHSLALLLADAGRTNEALAELREASRLFPGDALSRNALANLLADSGQTNEALAEFQKALQTNPQNALLHDNLGTLLVQLGRLDESMKHYAEAARLDPADWRPAYLMGKVRLKQGRDAEAIPLFQQAIQMNPDNPQVLIYMAQVLASDENPKVRDGPAALALATKANALTGGVQPAMLDVLAMACAELGRFDDAQKNAQAALKLVIASRLTNEEAVVQQRLQLYQNHQPFRRSFAQTP
jgi:tetratricopeptide (TPR) repeat protein